MKDNQSKTRTKNYNQTPFSQSLTISVICIPFSGILKLFCSRTRNTINILYGTAIIKIQRSTITRSSKRSARNRGNIAKTLRTSMTTRAR